MQIMTRKKKKAQRIKLIFNPAAGDHAAPEDKLVDVINELQKWDMLPETFLIEPDCDLQGMVQDALKRKIRKFVVCGGDGTISSVAHLLSGRHATMGIVPTGTQNNTALSLGISSDITEAILTIHNGRSINVDLGMAATDENKTPFLEVCSVGLASALFPAADDIQHGNLASIADFMATLATTPPAEIQLTLEKNEIIHDKGYVVLVTNMPYIGLHYHIGPQASYRDGLLDVLFFPELSKLDLIAYVFQGIGEGKPEDPRIQHFHVSSITIDSEPPMPVLIDGITIGKGRVKIEVKPKALSVMVPTTVAAIEPDLEALKAASPGKTVTHA